MKLLRLLRKGLAATLILTAVAIVSGAMTMWFAAEKDKVRLPRVIGMDSTAALELLRDQSLQPKVSGREYSEAIPQDAVLSQRPASGSWVKKNSDVRLVVSQGSDAVALPNLTGLPLPQAQQLLQAHGLTLGRVAQVHSSERPKGEVIAQDPEAGALLRRGSPVAVLLSLGQLDEVSSVLTPPALSLLEPLGLKDRIRAIVKTKVMTKKGREVTVDYRTRRSPSDQWRSYDLDIDGLSLVDNYRSPFTTLIAHSSYQVPIEKLMAPAEKRPGALRGAASVLVGAGDIASRLSYAWSVRLLRLLR